MTDQFPEFPQQQAQEAPQGFPSPEASMQAGSQGSDELSNERVVELIEALIDEKWSDFTENVNRIIEWKDKTENRITGLEISLKDLRSEFDKLHKGILDKVGQYDQNIHDVGIEIKALEKVFQKILPTLTENVNELSRISKDFKSKPQ